MINPNNWKKILILSESQTWKKVLYVRSNQHLPVTTVYTVIRTTVDIVVKPVLKAEIFIHHVKTIRLLYRLTPGSLWCAWQSHRTDPTNQSAQKYRCSKHLAITRWSLQRIYINQNCFVKFQVTHQHLRSPQSHYVVLAVVEDKDIVIKSCCCNKHRAINQKYFSTGKIKQGKALREHNTTLWLSFWKWTSGLEAEQ